jgi:hypothetical protein
MKPPEPTPEPSLFALPPIVQECRDLRGLAEWAETLLCSARCPEMTDPKEWEAILWAWRDGFNALRPKSTVEIVEQRKNEEKTP